MALEALKRNGHRLELGTFETEGEYGIPVIQPVRLERYLPWISFNQALTFPQKKRAQYGVHFFVDDYLFERAWRDPPRYALLLSEFAAVTTPDFSMFTDWSKAVQVYNHWRKHQLGAYCQSEGVTVIPTICWSDTDSYDWCFDGEPKGGTVAVSSVGTQKNPDAKRCFGEGYATMMERLQPSKILLFGTVPAGCSGNIEQHSAYYASLPHAQRGGA